MSFLSRLVLGVALAGAAAAAPPARGAWPTFAGDLGRTGFDSQSTLTATNAPRLREAWTVRLGGALDAQPAVSDGPVPTVVAASEDGTVAAIDLASGRVRWRRRLASRKTSCADLPGGRYGISTTPVLAGGRVYVVAEDGRAFALALDSGRTLPGWPVRVVAQPAREHVWGALALWRGTLYVPTASRCDDAYYHGEIAAVSIRSHRVVTRWLAVPHGHGGGVWAWGGIAIDPARAVLYAATANAQGQDEARAYGEHVVALSRGLRVVAADHPSVPSRGDADFGGHPVLIDANGCPPLLAVAHKAGALLLYDRRRLGRGPVQRVQVGDASALNQLGTYAWSPPERTLYLANPTDGLLSHGLDALALGSDCRLHVRWQLAVAEPYRPGPPTVGAGGVVAWGTGASGTVDIADAEAGDTVAVLGPLRAAVYGGVTLAGTTVLVPAWDGRLHAFGLP